MTFSQGTWRQRKHKCDISIKQSCFQANVTPILNTVFALYQLSNTIAPFKLSDFSLVSLPRSTAKNVLYSYNDQLPSKFGNMPCFRSFLEEKDQHTLT